MAQQGKRVLLVDADFRSPSLHRIFNLRGRDGLSNLLAGQEIAGGIVHESGVSALDVVPCGTFLGNPPEMLGGERFGAVLEYITGIYDHVILDAPPTVPVDDARIIARSCDMTLLVLRAGRANRRLAELARDGLCAVGAKIMGVVVNDVDPHSYAKYDGVYEDGPVAGATPTRQASAPAEEVAGDFDVQLRTMLARRPAAAATPHFNTSGGADKSAGRTQAQAVHHGSIDADLDDDQTDRDSSDRR